MSLLRFLAVLFLFLLSLAGAGRISKLTGVITQVQGAVQAVGPGASRLPLVSPWQVIGAGVSIRVPEGGAAGIVCSNRRFVRLPGPVSWSLTEAACANGKELTPAEYALIAPQGGRFKVVEELLVLERGIRGGDEDPLAPIVLQPRHAILRSPRPTVSWLRVPSATEYEVQWTGRGTAGLETRLLAGQVSCGEKREGLSVCSLPWPEARPDLPPGEIFFLKIAARSGIAEPWHANDPVRVRSQTIKNRAVLESELRDLDRLGLRGAVLDAARAGLLAQHGLYADAAELYRQALDAVPAPELRITLADLDLAMGLAFLAEPRYREGLSEAAASVRAAAAFGVGQVHYLRGRYREAAPSFLQACELYSRLGLKEEEAAARHAAAKAAERAPL